MWRCFGIPNVEFGEEVKAVVQPIQWPVDGKVIEQELLIWLREFLSPVKVPRSIDFFARIAALGQREAL